MIHAQDFHMPTESVDGWRARTIWSEARELAGDTQAIVNAFVVPKPGVGWVDFEWKRFGLLHVREVRPEAQRLFADWSGWSHAEIVRQVIPIADEWFIYCKEQAEREAAVKALAGESKDTARSATMEEMMQRQQIAMLKAERWTGDPLDDAEKLAGIGPGLGEYFSPVQEKAWTAGLLSGTGLTGVANFGSPPPDTREDGVEGVLPALTRGAGLGSPERPRDRSGGFGNYVPEPHVPR